MIAKDIENVELKFLDLNDYQELKTVMKQVYKNMPDNYWEEKQIKSLIKKFPEGQVVIKMNDELAGCSLSIVVDYDRFEDNHTFQEIMGQETFSTHTEDGDVLYGIDIFIKPEYRGLRLDRRLYGYRKELCEKLNLKSIAFGGRIPNYHQWRKSGSHSQCRNNPDCRSGPRSAPQTEPVRGRTQPKG
jgi:hypothetical protein